MKDFKQQDINYLIELTVCTYLRVKRLGYKVDDFGESMESFIKNDFLKVVMRTEQMHKLTWKLELLKAFNTNAPETNFINISSKLEELELLVKCRELAGAVEHQQLRFIAFLFLDKWIKRVNSLSDKDISVLSRLLGPKPRAIAPAIKGQFILDEIDSTVNTWNKVKRANKGLDSVVDCDVNIAVYRFDGRAILTIYEKVPARFVGFHWKYKDTNVVDVASAISTVLDDSSYEILDEK